MANKKPMPTLYIGLGGSGAWTGVHVKKQLYDTYDNKLPDNVNIVVLDTTDQMRVSVGGSDLIRREGMGFGRVTLKESEWTWLGGDVYDLARDMTSSNNYSHISSWFQADVYLKEANRALFQINKGAGQFRQFGRMAVFRDLLAPAESRVRQIIDNKLLSLADNQGGSISVMIVGSLVGGTGAGLFLDIAHLVRLAAQQNGLNIKLRGFFYLPEAFNAVLDGDQLDKAKPRAFGAMRELNRFLLNGDHEIGYPMYYQPAMRGLGQSLWRGKQKGRLFDFVYMIDGRGELKMNNKELKDGSASVVADAIVSYIDHHFGQYQAEYDANIDSRALINRQNLGKQAFISTIGTHSIILPVQQMIESWTFRLGRELMQALVPGEDYGVDDEVLGGLSSTQNPLQTSTQPFDAASDLLQSSTGMIDPDNDDNNQIKPLPFWGQAVKMYDSIKEETGDQALRRLRAQPLENWRGMLVPLGMEADRKIAAAIRDTRAALNTSIHDIESAHPSDKRKQRDPDGDWRVIARTIQEFLNNQLGPIASGGGRTGGNFKIALDQFVDIQVERFSNYMRIYVLRTLNGTLTLEQDNILAKKGKLGWLIAVVTELRNLFGEVSSSLEQVRVGRGSQGPDKGAMIEKRYRDAGEDMKAKAGETQFMGEDPYITVQKNYISAAEAYLVYYRTDFARNAVGITTQRFTDFLAGLLEELDLWQQLLATNNDSLYMRMVNGESIIRGERERINELANHTVIKDAEWEDEKFQEYVREREAANKLFAAWNWQTSIELDGRGKPSLIVKVAVDDQVLEKDIRRKWSDKNADAVLGFARKFFTQAIEKESITKYLINVMYPDNSEGLGNYLAEKSGHLLDMSETAIGTRARSFILLAHDSGREGERPYLQGALSQLVARRGFGDSEGTNNAISKLLESDDSFRLTLLSSADLIPLTQINSWVTAKPIYLATKYDSRQLYHTFPAEENATYYEDALVNLQQSKRLLEERVVLLLEDKDRLAHFLFLLAHGIIYRADIEHEGQTKSHWVMILPEKRGENNEWWLTIPSQKPQLMEAVVNFAIVQDDARSREKDASYTNSIGSRYTQILDYLAQAQREDSIPRIENDNLALRDDTVRGWLEAFLPPLDDEGNELLEGYTPEDEQNFYEVAELVARRDIMFELSDFMKGRLPELQRTVESEDQLAKMAHDERDKIQEEFDFLSVSILLLENEIQKIDERVERKYLRHIGQDPRF